MILLLRQEAPLCEHERQRLNIGNRLKHLSRDVPVRWETVRENAFNDPSHDNVLHHGYFIANRKNAQVQLV